MIFDKKDNNTTIVIQETANLQTFCSRLKGDYDKIRTDNVIINLFSLQGLTVNDLLEFLEISNTHRGAGKSFVIITDKINYDEVPDELVVVPTLQEAHDIIEMEEIERDLGF